MKAGGDWSMLLSRGNPRFTGVSEVIGTLVLVAVVMIGIAIVGLFLFASPAPTKVPVLDTIISNRSKTIYILHKGGDALFKGQYKILVGGGDQTANFTILGSGTEPWSVGETLTGIAPVMPKRVVIFFNQTGTGGNAGVLASQDLMGSVTLSMDPGQGWYSHPTIGSNAWHYRKKITIDHTQVTADQSNFPVLISMTDTDLKTKSTGSDILFTASDGTTKLNHEIENYTASTGYLVAWVGVPTLSSTTDTALYLYYGNSSATGLQNPEGVWDSNFSAVWHHDTVLTDSTSNNNDGTDSGSADAVGMIAHGRNYAMSNDWVQMAASASLNNLFAGGGTFSAWIYPRSVGEGASSTDGGRIGDKSNSYVGATGWGFGLFTGLNLSFRKGFSTTAGWWCSPTGSIPVSSWSYVVVTYDNTSAANNPMFYINGASSTTRRMTAPVGNPQSDTGQGMRIGNSNAGNARDFDGIIDEIRASKTIRSASWILTEYNNQNNPSGFYSIGSEEQF
jgi:Concanavalin A-like lectin/glucanases superfamily/Archaeal Type IV pilin, N-terminal/Domain of unknown function (DUF2341)